MARGSSSSAPPPATFAVFVNTSLDTHLAMAVSPGDTIGDLKRKIRIEHALCFPNIGEITVQSMKVRRRGSFYHLSDYMLVKCAFDGMKGTWFLHMDAVSSDHQAVTAENVANQNVGQSQKHRLCDMEPNVSTLGSSAARVHGKKMLPETCLQVLSVHNNSSLPYAGNSNDHFVLNDANAGVLTHMNLCANGLWNDRGMPPTEHEKRSDHDELELQEPVREGDVAVGSHLQPETDEVVDQGEKDDREEDHGDLGVEANGGFVSIKKEKSRKRSNASQNDRLLEKDGSFMEKKKHKKRKGDRYEDPVANFGSCAHSKETSILENIHPETSTPHYDDSSPKDLTNDEKKKKKRRKKGASKFDDDIASAIPETKPPETGPSDTPLNKTGDVVSLGKQVTEENLQETFISNHANMGEESDAVLFTDEATRNVTGGDSLEVGAADPLFSNLKCSNCSGETSPKIRLSNHGSSNDYPIQEQVTGADPQGTLGDKHTDLSKESDAAVTLQEAAPFRNPAKVDSEVPTNSRHSKKKSKGESSRNASSKYDPLRSSRDHVNEKNLEEASGNNQNNLSKESDVMTAVEEAMDHRNPAKGDSEVPSNTNVKGSHHRRRKKSGETELSNPQSNTYEPVHSSGGQITEDNPKEISDDHHKDPQKEPKGTTAIGESAILRNPAVEGYTSPSNPNGKNSRCRRKKSAKAELPNHNSVDKDPIDSLVKEITEENPKGTLEDSNKEQGKESPSATILGEATVLGNPAIEDTAVPSNPNDRKSRCRRKKPTKAEWPNHDSIDKEPVHSFVKEATGENPKETMEDSHKGQGKESKSTTILGEAAVLVNPAVQDSAVSSNPNGRNSRRRRKKAAKAKLPNHDSIDKKPVDSLVKEATEENLKETMEDSLKEQGKESNSTTDLAEAAALGDTADVNLSIPSDTNDRSSHQHNKKKAKTEISYYSFSNYDVDHSSGNRCPQENLEKTMGTTPRDSGNKSNTGTTPDETAQNLVHGNHIDVNSTVLLYDSSNRHDIALHSTEKLIEEDTEGLLGKTHENSGKDTSQNETHKRPAESIEANNQMELPKSDSDKVHFIEFFVPKVAQLESHASAREFSSMETETRKPDEEKTKRIKRKLNLHSEDSTHDLVNPSSLNKKDMIRKKPQDGDSGNHGLVNSLVQPTAKEPKTKRAHIGKTVGRSESDLHLGDTSSDLGAIRSPHDKNRLEKKPKVYNSDTSMLKDEQSKHLKGKTSAVSGSKLKSIPHHEGNDIMDCADENRQPNNYDDFIRSNSVAKPVTQHHSSAGADVSLKETMADLAASSDSTEEDTLSRQYRVAVRKVPSSRFGSNLSDTSQEKIMFATSGTIFNDTISESSEDEFEIDNRKATSKFVSDNSSTSADSDRGLEETRTKTSLEPHAYMNSPGIESEVYGENDEGTGGIILTQPSRAVKKSRSLSNILRSTSSYRKAKLTASQSQVEDSESQPPV